jgi:hypothetical protein
MSMYCVQAHRLGILLGPLVHPQAMVGIILAVGTYISRVNSAVRAQLVLVVVHHDNTQRQLLSIYPQLKGRREKTPYKSIS